jgi:hypothetical protein
MATKKERGGVIDQASAEELLRRYLDERGWRYEWECREFGGKKPDAVILSEAGDPIAAVDATIVIEPADKQAALIAEREGVDALPIEPTHSQLCEAISRAIARKAERASPVAAAGLPYLIAAHIPGCPSMERIAHLVIDALMRAPAISAFGILRELDATVVNKYIEFAGQHTWSPPPPTPTLTVMELLLNPCARVAWQEGLWGDTDQVWGWVEDLQKLQMVHDGRWWGLYRLFRLAGSVSAPIKEGVRMSRSENFYEEREW